PADPSTPLVGPQLSGLNTAATKIGSSLESSAPQASAATRNTFSPLSCGPTSGVLGSAGPQTVHANFTGAPLTDVWYYGALADSLAGADLAPESFDIFAQFNGAIGVDPNCLTGQSWYNGFDHNNDPASEIDLLAVVMHEITHGLGFLEIVDETTGESLAPPLLDVYALNMLDTTFGATWDLLTAAERLQSQVNAGNLVWAGPNVTDEAPTVLGPRPSVRVFTPRRLRGSYEAQPASFGPPLTQRRATVGRFVVADDGVDSGGDGCEPIENRVKRRIALIDRGGCDFTQKVLNAQNAGARAVIVVNNQPAGLPPMGGFDDSITIPSVGVSFADGEAFKDAAERRIIGKLKLDRRFLAGANQDGLVRLFAPDPVQPGSSKSHFDTSATPNLLMEPSINDDLAPTLFLDLTVPLLRDIGWNVP
ncbi:MAG: PA domain-containing protein, partial [Pseudomonadota bacterium]